MQRVTNGKFNGLNVYSADKICPFCGNGLLTTESPSDDDSSEEVITVKAENVITNYDRRFISDDLLKKISKVISNYMNIEQYDSDNDGIIDKSKVSQSVENISWGEIQDKPDINLEGIEDTINIAHRHSNSIALNKLGDNNNLPTWNGNDWPYPTKNDKFIPLGEKSYRNIIISNNISYSDTKIGDIWFEIENSIESNESIINSINVKLTDTTWAKISINDILTKSVNMITPIIYDIIEQTQITDHEEMNNLYGGNIDGHYHLTKEEYDKLKEIINNYDNISTNQTRSILWGIINDS